VQPVWVAAEPQDSSGFRPLGWLLVEYRPYFENYTVDASIFNMTLWGCVVKDDLKDH